MYLPFTPNPTMLTSVGAMQHKLRRTRLPLLSNFLLTSDAITADSETSPAVTADPLTPPPRSRVAPLYYLPAVLTPAQEAFLSKRKEEVCGVSPCLLEVNDANFCTIGQGCR